jgi:ferric-dicitrate binding protein FerR (iron transport regulator)
MNSRGTELDRLLEAYFGETLNVDGKAELEKRLTSDPDARKRYWEMARWHAALSTWGSQQVGRRLVTLPLSETDGLVPAASEESAATIHPRWRGWTFVALAAAACVMLGSIFVWKIAGSGRSGAGAMAELVLERGTRWVGQAPGHDIVASSRPFKLEAGIATFNTSAGAVITVAAPAEFAFTAPGRMDLTNGRIAARMLRHGSGALTVNVRGVKVTDLGTAFGIDARQSRQTLVSVFDGMVAVSNAAAGQPTRRLVAQGQSVVAYQRRDDSVQSVPYAAEPFGDLWPLTVGINESSQLVSFLPPGPLTQPLRDYHANHKIFLFPERQNIVAQRATPLDISPETLNWPDSPVTPYPLAAGRAVNSYLVFYQPDPVAQGLTPQHLAGQIVFRHRILGIICSDQWLDMTDGSLGVPAADYATPGQHRGLEEADKDNYRGTKLHHDSVKIDPDGKTVHFDFYVSDEREELRIVVAAE